MTKLALVLGLLLSPLQSYSADAWCKDLFMPEFFHGDALKVSQISGGSQSSVGRARFSADSRWIGAELIDGKLRVANVVTGRNLLIEADDHRIFSFDFSPDSSQILVRFTGKSASSCCGNQNAVQIWSLESGRPISPHIPTRGSHATGHFTKDGKWLLAENDDVLHVIDAATGRDTGRTLVHDLNSRDDGDYLLGLGSGGIARVTNIVTGKEVAYLDFQSRWQVFGELSAAHGIVVLEDATAPPGHRAGVPILRDLHTLAPLATQLDAKGIASDATAIGPDLSSGGNWVYSLYYSNRKGTGIFWNTKTGRQIHRISDASVHPRYTADEQWGAVAVEKRTDGDKKEISTALFNRSGKIQTVPGTPVGAGFFGRILITVVQGGYGKKSAYFRTDVDTGLTTPMGDSFRELSISPDGRRFFYNRAGTLHLFDIAP